MTDQLLTTKLYIPPTRKELVLRPRLIERLNEGITHKLVLLSAPAGFGKTTLLSDWVHKIDLPVAWLSLDKGDNDQIRFLGYLIAALQTIDSNLGRTTQAMLQSPQPPPIESALTSLINQIASLPQNFVLILDDYHLVEDLAIHEALTDLISHMPPVMHLVLSSRSDPFLPLSRLRARNEMVEIRVEDLRFSTREATTFLKQVMGLSLSESDILSLEKRTEGWIAGLQLAALSLQGKEDTSELINTFSGSHRLVLDYLIDEVLDQQPESIQTFLLQTSILDRLSGDLCDAVTGLGDSQQTLQYLEETNLFIIPLDSERRWYRYHHLFADLLRVRMQQSTSRDGTAELHIRASEWYEINGLEVEAFQHAAAAKDIERAERLIAGGGVPLQYRGASALVLSWLVSLPEEELDARPLLWVTYASALNLSGQAPEAEQKLLNAEASLEHVGPGENTDDIIGQIAAIRAMIAVGLHQLDAIIVQSRIALEYLHPENLPLRTISAWTLGYAYQLQGDRAAASQAYSKVLDNSQRSGDIISTLAATTGLGNIQESENQLFLAVESYERGLELFGKPPQPVACGVYLGLAGIYYEWNDLQAAEEHGQLSLKLAQRIHGIDTPVLCWLLLTRLKLAEGDLPGAAAQAAKAEQYMIKNNFEHRLQEFAAVKVLLLLHNGDLTNAADLAENHELPISQARVYIAHGDASAALKILEKYHQEVDANGFEDEHLRVLVLRAIALYSNGQTNQAVQVLNEALIMAEPGGFIRTFVDEGLPMEQLLCEVLRHKISPDYVSRLLEAFPHRDGETPARMRFETPGAETIEPLTRREIEVMKLLKTELTGPEIAQELVIALSTYQSHTKSIYSKLAVTNRRAAVIKAEDHNLI